MAERLKKEGVLEKAQRLLRQQLYIEDNHFIHQARDREISRPDIQCVLETGRHLSEKDEYDPDRESVKHVIEGFSVDGRKMRVVIYFKKEDPIPDEFVFVLTAFWRGGK